MLRLRKSQKVYSQPRFHQEFDEAENQRGYKSWTDVSALAYSPLSNLIICIENGSYPYAELSGWLI